MEQGEVDALVRKFDEKGFAKLSKGKEKPEEMDKE
jgi:hypothetical protein